MRRKKYEEMTPFERLNCLKRLDNHHEHFIFFLTALEAVALTIYIIIKIWEV